MIVSPTSLGASPPPATLALATSLLLCSLHALNGPEQLLLVALVPGQALIGATRLWTLVTASFTETSPPRLALTLVLVGLVGSRAELPTGRHTAARVLRTALLAALFAGLATAIASLGAFISTGREPYLYAPQHGSGPLLGALSVLAFEVYGDAHCITLGAGAISGAAAPAVPLLRYAVLPFLVLGGSALSQYFFLVGTDTAATAVAILSAWCYLRFFCRHGDGLLGDTRDEFEFLAMVPGPLRIALRPLAKLCSAMLRPIVVQLAAAVSGGSGADGGAGAPLQQQQLVLPLSAVAAPAAGGLPLYGAAALQLGGVSGVGAGSSSSGSASSIYGGATILGQSGGAAEGLSAPNLQRIDLHVHLHGGRPTTGPGAGGLAADPVAERRREKALRALDKRLADLRGKLKPNMPVLPSVSAPP